MNNKSSIFYNKQCWSILVNIFWNIHYPHLVISHLSWCAKLGVMRHCTEQTVEFEIEKWSVRLWLNGTENDTEVLVKQFVEWYSSSGDQTQETMVEWFESNASNLNAVQVKNIGNPSFGLMIYTVAF